VELRRIGDDGLECHEFPANQFRDMLWNSLKLGILWRVIRAFRRHHVEQLGDIRVDIGFVLRRARSGKRNETAKSTSGRRNSGSHFLFSFEGSNPSADEAGYYQRFVAII
jgi:hypothetical protein